MNRFQDKLLFLGAELRKARVEILQINLGKLCNMTCVHCHVEAGPTKTRENMDRKTAEAVVTYLKHSGIQTLDLTGGAPEMNPNFRYLVIEVRRLGAHVIDRCNLTVLFLPGHEDLGQFLADNNVEIVASLPCYLQENVDKQRGKGTFDQSIKALQYLNELGYGKLGARLPRPMQGGETPPLQLNLVYNPVGPYPPSDQRELEKEYKKRLKEDWGIVFNKLYTITNMPITRYAKYLKALNQHEVYVELLINSFNPATLEGLMCRNTLSVGWDGKLYDCDFNQMLGIEIGNGNVLTIQDLNAGADPCVRPEEKGRHGRLPLQGRKILTGDHCFGCTAGCGSSCGGSLVNPDLASQSAGLVERGGG